MAKNIVIALAGNPNAGKTSMFNALTGARAHVGNYPGVTVEKRVGHFAHRGQTIEVVDLPGTYSLTAYSLEELVARQYILDEKPDLVVDVVDASNLERNLYLALQFMEIGVPVVIALNMMDMAEKRGLRIDIGKLRDLLGVEIVPTVARAGQGLVELQEAILRAVETSKDRVPKRVVYGPDLDVRIDQITALIEKGSYPKEKYPPRWLAVKVLEGDEEVRKVLARDPETHARIDRAVAEVTRHLKATLDDEPEGVVADHRYGFITSVTKQAVTVAQDIRRNFSDKIDLVLLNRLIGPLILLLVLYAVYQFTFLLSEQPVAWFEALFGLLGDFFNKVLPEGPIRSLIVSGLIDGVGGVVGFVPLIAFMFFAIAFLEDSGYMARIAFILDRVLRTFGLHGSSVLSLMVGGGIAGGCAVPGVMAARTLRDPKERLATILVTPMMNCGAKMPVYAVLIAAFFSGSRAWMMFLLTLIAWVMALLSARLMRSSVLRGHHTPFVMELPPYRLPTLRGLLIHSWERIWQYVKKAGTVILAISILIWAMMTYPGLPEDQAGQFQKQREALAEKSQAGPAPAADMDEASREALGKIDAAEAEARLRHSAAGRLGTALEPAMGLLGFDWRTNIALIGGFAAKEVVLSTLGTAHSLGEADDAGQSLTEALTADPGWTPLSAFALMIFVMLYSPCFVTLVTIGREAGWKWALFSMVYSTALAFVMGLGIFQIGRAFGLGR